MTKKLYRVIAKLNRDMERYVYKSREDAWKDLEDAHKKGFPGIAGRTMEFCVEQGFYSVEELELVEFDND